MYRWCVAVCVTVCEKFDRSLDPPSIEHMIPNHEVGGSQLLEVATTFEY